MVLKRSREDKVFFKNGSPQKQSNQLDSSIVEPKANKSSPTKLVNPNHTKIVTNYLPPRPCTPRYPIKQINVSRKLKSRHSLVAKAKLQQTKMVVSTIPNRCATPTTATSNSSPLVSLATGTDCQQNGTAAADEESDTGCSSLEDDDDFGGKTN